MIIAISILSIVLIASLALNAFQFKKNGLLSDQNIELQQALESNTKSDEEVEETGHYVKRRVTRRATPTTYQAVFDLDRNGIRVLEDLTARFCRSAFVSDSHGGERETCRRLGNQEVINFVVLQVSKANDPNYKEESENES